VNKVLKEMKLSLGKISVLFSAVILLSLLANSQAAYDSLSGQIILLFQ
jgi:hypothetical protein